MFAVAITTSALSGSGCTDSSAGQGAGGVAGGAAKAAGGSAGGHIVSAGGAPGTFPGSAAACTTTAAAISGIDPTTRLDALTPDQKAAYCDWAASRYCGYAHLVDCGDGNYLGVTSQADCVDNMNNTVCASTIAENEACEQATSCADTFPDVCVAVSMCQ